MPQEQIWSIVIGLALALINGAASLIVLRRSMSLSLQKALRRVLGSLGVRMLVLFVLVVAILWWVPVDAFSFGMAFVVGVIAGLTIEMWFLLRWARSSA